MSRAERLAFNIFNLLSPIQCASGSDRRLDMDPERPLKADSTAYRSCFRAAESWICGRVPAF